MVLNKNSILFLQGMKKSTQYILLTIFTLLVLIGLQSYSLYRIYKLESERIENRFRETIKEGIVAFEKANPGKGLETAQLALENDASYNLGYFHSGIVKDTLIFRNLVLMEAHKTFNDYQNLNSVVRNVFKKSNISTKFKIYLVFTDYRLESYSYGLNVYNQKDDSDWEYPDTLGISNQAFLLSRYSIVSDSFSCKYNFLIDFSDMRRMVIGEITGVLILMIISLIIVGLIFIVTLRSMLEERRLSLLKTDFINNMTHELKTPLSTIAIATRSLEQDSFIKDLEKVKGTARVIGRQNKQLSKQIKHLLDVSMWERQQFELDKRWVNLHDFMTDLVEAFRWEFKDQNVTIISSCDLNEELEVFIDEMQLATAIHNLMINGVKYNDKDPIIEISCVVADSLIIKVIDNGIGLSKESTKHIFEKFYRVHTGNIHKVKGLGLGLFYVKEIMQAHKGTINLKSKIGKGSEFIIKLPNNGRPKNSTR